MTAEIAILNRSAVALAADSAVTLGVRGQQKIYNSVDKLFQLALHEPVGIMVFGGAEFMGIPVETVIKKFRESALCVPKKKLKDYSDDFFKFLEAEIPVPPELSRQNLERILSESFTIINGKAFRHYMGAATAPGKKPRIDVKQFMEDAITRYTKAAIEALRKETDNKYVKIEESPEIKALIDSIIPQTFAVQLSDPAKVLLVELSMLTINKDYYSGAAMGIVFAGFGQDELFPKLQAFYSDGLINGAVKRHEVRYVDIKRSGDGAGARIEAFAQTEMVDRFLDGIDPGFEQYLRSAMKDGLNDIGNEILNSFGKKTSKANKAKIIAKIAEVADGYLAAFSEKSDKRKEENYRQRVLDMVHFMPKSDLANMAESLINLTSTKRRVSAESETVGGPIDVAVISKYDGFVWIKRKHYFTRELNPRYFISKMKPEKEAT